MSISVPNSNRSSDQPEGKSSKRGIVTAILVSLAMWAFILMGVVGLVLKILS